MRETLLQCGNQLMADATVILVDDDDHHELTLGIASDHQVAHQPLMMAHAVVRQTMLHSELPDKQTDIIGRIGLEMALLHIHHTVEQLRQMETQSLAIVLAAGACGSPVGEPFAVGEGIFQLVAVVILLLATQDGTNPRILYLADTVEVVLHLLLLVMELPLVVHLLPLAAAAKTEVLTHRRHALVGVLLEVEDATLEIVFLLFIDFKVHHVAGHAKGDEDHATFRLGHRHAFAAGIDDQDVLNVFWGFFLFHCSDR